MTPPAARISSLSSDSYYGALTNKLPGDQADPPDPKQPTRSETSPRITRVSAQNMPATSTSRFKALTDLDDPDFGFATREPPGSLSLSAANENSLGPARVRVSAAHAAAPATPADAPEPDAATRAHTHVAQDAWFDVKLDALGALDPRQALAWRYEAAFVAHALLMPSASSTEARELLVNVLRGYEKRLRDAAGSADERTGQSTVALHGLLKDSAVEALEPMMSELEVTLLTMDEYVSEEQFRKNFTRQHVEPKLLLQYARFLASRGFGIGYQRDRFEFLAQELLTTKLPSGKLLLTSRKRATNLLMRLTRGLKRPDAATALATPVSYLRDSLERLQNLTRAQQFFDSGFYVDVYGYKLSKPDYVTSPEFLYLCVALNVEVYNCLHNWSLNAEPAAIAALQTQLSEQQQAARAVFSGFHLPLGGADRAAKKPKRMARSWSLPGSTLLRLAAAGVALALVVGANLIVLGVWHIEQPLEALTADRIATLSPLLLDGRLTQGGKHFVGTLARPAWNRMKPRERKEAAEKFAQALKAEGIDHGEVLAYKTRAIQVDFGSVVFVDDGQQ